MVDVKLYKPYEGSKEYTGKLVGYDENDGTVTIEVDDKNIAFTKKEIAGIRLAVIF